MLVSSPNFLAGLHDLSVQRHWEYYPHTAGREQLFVHYSDPQHFGWATDLTANVQARILLLCKRNCFRHRRDNLCITFKVLSFIYVINFFLICDMNLIIFIHKCKGKR